MDHRPDKLFLIYHLHFFFDLEETEYVHKIHEKVTNQISHLAKIFPLLLRPAGPLPKPMFMLEFSKDVMSEIILFFKQYEENYSILIHPELANEVLAHTDHSIWMGKRIPLRLEYLT
ncbi:DOPA 4,5-dioxygenase family protein [Acinetobacter boissieri]|uniref:DOPA 4,5-dioxygenase n=1 Tax=Acinetobacter boissieri TaxID=1219383 RepID=A0A1G6GH10_9GAMM|nr:DOPA 4,5-dioxygenase family protein [Acinetobacter boissieri]SDB81277.1 DOPA 4,5-dioxygenase [Acinetobacter boissieri]